MRKILARDDWTREQEARARQILLEKSPYGLDGGQLLGRDPRQIGADEFHQAGIAADVRILDVIRAKCLDCCAEQPEEVRKCVSFACPNWPYRMGSSPFRTVNLTAAERERRAAQGRANMAARKSAAKAVT
jgi:hypothetical protein